MKLTQVGNTIINASGRIVGTIKENKCYIAQKDFRRAVRKIRTILGTNIYFVIE